MNEKKKIAVIGAGAAGFFGALSCKQHHPFSEVIIFEKSDKVLSKVKVSGGGRCNVTNGCMEPHLLVKNYPRGSKELRQAFEQFSGHNTVAWFEQHGVRLKKEEDGRMFPVSDNSETIINCFLNEAKKQQIKIQLRSEIKNITPKEGKFILEIREQTPVAVDRILITSGGFPKENQYDWLQALKHNIVSPVPSLFTFNIPDSKFKDLLGISVPEAEIKIEGTSEKQNGPLLITHWGLSGPCVLKLSAWAARQLHDLNYQFKIKVNWIPAYTEGQLKENLAQQKKIHPKQQIVSHPLFLLPKRLWERMCMLSEIADDTRWADISNRNINKLCEELLQCSLAVKGKTTFKEEFVTAGGVDLKEINFSTMESKICPGVFFAGEILNIDGITGGFNFQAAWTTSWIAGKNIGR